MVTRTRVKVCGLTRHEDVIAAVRAGVDAIGLNFFPSSPRFVAPELAAELVDCAGPLVTCVGLFVDADPDVVESTLARVPLGQLQFHGSEDEQDCVRWGKPYFKAVRMRADLVLQRALGAHARAAGFLLDAYRPGVPGGTGETFDWDRIPRDAGRPIMLAGGLHAGNVAAAIASVRPYAVDVSGGVEAAPGIKDPGRMEAFTDAVREADACAAAHSASAGADTRARAEYEDR